MKLELQASGHIASCSTSAARACFDPRGLCHLRCAHQKFWEREPENGKFPKVVRRGCKRWFEPREQKSPKSLFAPSETRFAPVQPQFALVQPHFRALGSKDLLHPLLPKGPSRTKNSTESRFSTGSKFATAVAKWYGECSEMLVFLGKRGRKTVQRVKNYGGSKILRIRAPYYF